MRNHSLPLKTYIITLNLEPLMIRRLNKKDKLNFVEYCKNSDKYLDFYTLRKGERLFLKNSDVAEKVFNKIIKHNDVGYILENKDIEGIVLILGIADKSDRRYLRMIGNNIKVVDKLFRFIFWHYEKDLYLKLKKYNPILKFLVKDVKNGKFSYKFGFEYIYTKGKEVFLYRKAYKNKVLFPKAEDINAE